VRDDALRTYGEARRVLVVDGYAPAAVEAVLAAAITAGLEHVPQPNKEWLFTPAEIEACRIRLGGV
jgi:hypothetical protein